MIKISKEINSSLNKIGFLTLSFDKINLLKEKCYCFGFYSENLLDLIIVEGFSAFWTDFWSNFCQAAVTEGMKTACYDNTCTLSLVIIVFLVANSARICFSVFFLLEVL
jgi:hypothetical protein